MAKTVIALFVRSDAVTYVAAKGKRVIKWAELPLEPGLVKDGLISDTGALSSRLREFIRDQGIRPTRVIAGLTGLHCLTQTMVLPHVQKSMAGEAIRREAELALPVPLEQLYLSWQIVASTSEAVNVFLAASPRNTADTLIETLRIAGVKPYLMDLAPLALSRLATSITGVLADMRPTEVDIIVNVDGLPQLVRSQTYPAEAKTVQEKLLYVKEELERSIDFYDSAHPDKPLDAAAFSGRLPIHVCGKLVQELAACQFLAAELNRSVLPFQPTLKVPPNFPATQFMVNVGLASKAIADDGEDFSGINVNVLPEQHRPKPFSYGKVAMAVGSVAAAAVVVFFSVLQVRTASATTTSMQKQLATANSQFEKKYSAMQAQKQQATDLTKKLNATKLTYDALAAKLNVLNTISGGFSQEKQQVNDEMAVATSVAPDGISLKLVARGDDSVMVQGTGVDQATVLAYARALRQSGKFVSVVVSSLQTKAASATVFSLTLEEKGQQ